MALPWNLGDPDRSEVTLETFDFWNNKDATLFPVKYGPITEGQLKTKEALKQT
jgi:hypothetical protein